jgi:hypothetical protein
MWETYFCMCFQSLNGRLKPLQSFCIQFSVTLPNIIRHSTSNSIIWIRHVAQVSQEMHKGYSSEVLKGGVEYAKKITEG